MLRAVLGHGAGFPTTATGEQILFAYDPLNRMETTTVKNGNDTLFTTEYGYKNKSATQTTNRVDTRDVYLGQKNPAGSNTRYHFKEGEAEAQARRRDAP